MRSMTIKKLKTYEQRDKVGEVTLHHPCVGVTCEVKFFRNQVYFLLDDFSSLSLS